MRRWLTIVVAALCALVPVAAGAQNLLLNPSFEIDAVNDGVAPGWGTEATGPGDAWLHDWYGPVDNWVAVGGGWGITTTATVAWGQYVPCSPGQSVTLRAWSYGYPNFLGNTRLRLEFFYPNTEGSVMELSHADSNVLSNAQDWTQRSVTATAPAQASRVRAVLLGDAITDGSFKFDDVELETSGIPQMVTPGEAKGLPDGSAVWLKWPVLAHDIASDASHLDFQVAGYQREGAIRVITTAPVTSKNLQWAPVPGTMMYVAGTVATVGGEKVIEAYDVAPVNTRGPWPKGQYSMKTSSLLAGLSLDGYTVRSAGKVTAVAGDASYYYMDDGAGLPGPSGEKGVKVVFPGSPDNYPQVGDTVMATGIAASEAGGFWTIRTRNAADSEVVQIGSTGIGRNILVNPGFETGDAGWYKGSNKGYGAAIEGWAARSGTKGAAFYGWDGNKYEPLDAYWGQNVAVTPGATYEFSAWVLAEVATFKGDLTLKLSWRDSGGNPVGTAVVSPVLAAVNSWQQFAISGVAPAGTASVNAELNGVNITAGGATKLDDAVLKMTALP